MDITLRANPQKVLNGGTSLVAIKVTDGGKPAANQRVKLEFADGHECGGFTSAGGSSVTPTLSSTSADDGTVPPISFKGADYVENCVATIRVTIADATATATPPPAKAVAETPVTVNPSGLVNAKIDGVSAIAVVIVVSFAIDRIVRAALFLLSYWKKWVRLFPDVPLDDEVRRARVERNRTMVYFAIAGALAIVALGWFGNVRILAALGFTNVNRWLDVIVTGVILTGGAERMEQVLKSLGSGGAGSRASAPQPPAPIEVRGRLVIDEQGRRTIGISDGV